MGKKKKAKLGSENKPFDLTDVKPKKVFREILETVEDNKAGEFFFLVEKGTVKMTKTFNKKTGRSTTRFMLDNAMIPRSTLVAKITGNSGAGDKPKKLKDKEIDKLAKVQLLLTQKQLDKNYKVKDFCRSLDDRKYGKKKIRKAITKQLKDQKKITGTEAVKVMRKHYGEDIPTHDLFSIFEFMDKFAEKKLLK